MNSRNNLFSNLSIRFANLEDAENIAKIHVQAWHESYLGLIDINYINSITFEDRLRLRQQIFLTKNFQSKCFVACWQGHIIGFSDVGPSRESSNIKGEIYSLYLLQAYKKQGIGREMMKNIRTHFIQENLYPFMVWVLKENKVARRFYENQGGVEHGYEMSKMGDSSYPEICYKFESVKTS
ncbi:MAG: GNAT family N-acetyltransferase [Janthinobacterium lividum]